MAGRNAVEVTKLTTARLDALEAWVKDVAEATPHIEDYAAQEREIVELKQRLRDLENRVGCIVNTGFDPEARE